MFRKKEESRFEERLVQNSGQGIIYIWVDRETGVNYLYTWTAQGCALTPLLDEKGDVVVEQVGKATD
ncbi:hypothetical protein FLK61_38765 [Paenalkalicoccus suaedae]|uniref:DUF6440 domain-containing protein n=1 Tax=Paenalkalicoccus suaedae TaxID=2592382 RepID=A0A859FKK1_9BACI|nr:DUF6440 family protein [Paenalkalicoccus suaedae]QKS73331.1 hypothetical protein FLK61_38765 [Paenalkalicoccus suaedae]